MTDEDSNKGGIICCVLLLVIIGIFAFTGSQLSSVYFDNGYENSFDIFVDGKKKGSVAPNSIEKISIKKGEHTIEIRKKDGELFESNKVTLTEFKYIYNIGRKYFYYMEICEYKVGGGTKWGGWDTKNIGSETLIKYPEADYGFDEDCPGSIAVSAGNTYEERTKLNKKINPSSIEQTGTTDISQPEKEGWYHGSGGGALDVGQTSTINFDSPKTVDQAYIKVGCNDGEKMEGYIEYWNGKKWVNLTSFSDAGCGDYVHFSPVTTDKLRLTMTGGGGNDEHISWHGGGSDGWKAHVADDEGNKGNHLKTYAQKIISSDIRGSENQYKEPDAALGPPDAQSGYEGYVSLGGEGWIIVDMGKDIVDGTGYDLEIYELGSSYPDSNNEAYKIFASKYSDKDWIYLGKGLDISGFDLADAGVDSVRYVKIVDDTETNSGESPGADIDAIAGFLH